MSDLARERGCSPLDMLCEIAVAEDLKTRFRAYIANDDVDAVAHLLNTRASCSASPTRARTSTSCATPRCRPTCSARGCASARCMSLEHAVRKLTGEPADMFGFVRRGYLREGYWADVCVFDPETVGRARRGGCATSPPTPSA